MKKSKFVIGKCFYTATGKWLCTDVGTRTICAIKLDEEDPRNNAGPPYSVQETVFDECDFEGCQLKSL